MSLGVGSAIPFKALCYGTKKKKIVRLQLIAKGFVTELTFPYIQSVWGFKWRKIRTSKLAACCNYL